MDRSTHNVLRRLASRTVRIGGLGNACSRNAAVEGATVRLSADTSSFPSQTNLTFFWEASAGVAGPANLSVFDLTLPSPPVAVTVTVTVEDGSDCPGFGTLTFTPMTHDEYAQAQVICQIRELAVTSAIFGRPVRGVREGVRWFVDPLWDPIRGYVGPSLDRVALRAVATGARELGELAERLLVLRDRKGE